MKVLTLKQPFASLIASGIKEYEFRTWKTNYRGEVLIHTGKGIDKKALEKYKNYNLEYPSCCIIAKVTIKDCLEIDDDLRKILKQKNSYVYNNAIKNKEGKNYAFVLANIEKIDPIYDVKGKLSFWEYDYKEE